MASMPTRRRFLQTAGALTAFAFPRPALAQGPPRVIVIGGGFAGATCARELRGIDPKMRVMLVETNATFTACPLSNGVIAGSRDLKAQQFNYDGLGAKGVAVALLAATKVDPKARTVTLANGSSFPYERLVLAPGIDIRWNAIPGYDEKAAERMPHAWQAGPQTALLRKQLEAMEDGGLVVMTAPQPPYRCPPAPYERASLIAHYLKTKKPKSKIIIVDSKDTFSQQRLFQAAWAELYKGVLDWLPLSNGGNVTEVNPKTLTISSDFETYEAKVANVIPPQKAGRIAEIAGVADRTGWCPIDPVTFESTLQGGIHVIGDAAIMGAVPKSASSAHAEAKECAAAVVKLLRGEKPSETKLTGSCYSLAAPDYGFSISGSYRASNGLYAEEQAGVSSPADAPRDLRAKEAKDAEAWYRKITTDVFGQDRE
jgi:NADPH-dependent 2,4-dienoyl-CoA reductase/sulfur reductase-like enzyme